MSSSAASRRELRWASGSRYQLAAFCAAVTYYLLLGGGNAGEQLTVLRAVNFALGGVVIVWWVLHAREHDAIDLAVILAALLFTATALMSSSLRISLDSSIQALAYAALFSYARRLFARADGYAALTWTLGAICVAIAAFFAVEWGGVWLQWVTLTGFSEVPPLSLPLSGGPYLHRHDVALFLCMLAPALFFRQSPGRLLFVRVAVLLVIAALLVIDGSRTVVVSAIGAAAFAAVVELRRRGRFGLRLPSGTRARVVAGAITALAIALAVVAARPLLGRLFEFGTISARGSLWASAISVWLADPLTGSGPGTFLFAQYTTGYYDTSVYHPRNTDGAPFMLLAETGLLGVVAVVIVLVALIRGRRRSGAHLALLLFAPAAFVVAGIGQVPADFGFLVAPPLLWLAAAYPVETPTAVRRDDRPAHAFVRWASIACVGVLAAAVTCTTLGGLAYEGAVRAIRSGDLDTADTRLRNAVAADPEFALYWRALGAVELSGGGDALGALEAAHRAEARDPVTARLLTLAHVADGDAARATAAAERGLDLDALQPFHLVAAAIAATARGDDELATEYVDRYVVAAPWIMGIDEWPTSMGERRTVADAERLLDAAAPDARRIPLGLQMAILAGMARTDRHGDLIAEGTSTFPRTRDALTALLRCEPARASEILASGVSSEQAQSIFWFVKVMVDRVLQLDAERDERLGSFTGLYAAPPDSFASSRLEEMWAYRRVSLPEISLPFALPPYNGGAAGWVEDPVRAASAAGIDGLDDCGEGP